MQNSLRHLFPTFETDSNLVYLDSAATTLVPQTVVDAVSKALLDRAPIGRSLYSRAESATESIESIRQQTQQFLGAEHLEEVVFVPNSSTASQILAYGFENHLQAGDTVIIGSSEHHSSIIPWKVACQRSGATLTIIDVDLETGVVSAESISHALRNTPNTKILVLSHTSNTLGASCDVTSIASTIRELSPDTKFILDASQSVAHVSLKEEAYQVHALYFSSHKLYGPHGVGVLYGKKEFLSQLTPVLAGGGTLNSISSNLDISWKALPHLLEAGSPNQEAILGLGAAMQFTQETAYKQQSGITTLARNLHSELQSLPGITVISSQNTHSIVSFVHESIHSHDIAALLGEAGVCVRAGQHCASLLHKQLNTSASVRVSLGAYNSPSDTTALIITLENVLEKLSV